MMTEAARSESPRDLGKYSCRPRVWLSAVLAVRAALGLPDQPAAAEERTHHLTSPSFSTVVAESYPSSNLRIAVWLRFSQPGTILDTVGINAAPAGSFTFHHEPDGRLVFRVFDPARPSAGRHPSGWHILRSKTALRPDTDYAVDIDVGQTELVMRIGGQEEARLAFAAVLSGQPVYLGDFPGDDHWGSRYHIHPAMVGEVRVAYFGDLAKAPTAGAPAAPAGPAAPVAAAGTILTQQALKPSAVEQTVRLDTGLQITVPGGAVTQPAALVVRAPAELPPLPDPELKALAGYEIELGDQHAFAKPLTLSIPYDPAVVPAGVQPEAVLEACFWEPGAKLWVRLPRKVDAANHRVACQTTHLSLFSFFLRTVSQYANNIALTDHFEFTWAERRIQGEPAIRDAAWAAQLADPAQGPDPLDGAHLRRTPGMAYYIEYLALWLEYAYQKYQAAGYPVPTWTRTAVMVWPAQIAGVPIEPFREAVFGTIVIPRSVATPRLMRMTAAHEFFHTVEYQQFGTMGMVHRTWWMEACAEYAAYQVACNGRGELLPLAARYLDDSLTLTNGVHEYAAAYFLRFLAEHRGTPFHPLYFDYFEENRNKVVAEMGAAFTYVYAILARPLGRETSDEDIYQYSRQVTLGTLEKCLQAHNVPLPELFRQYAAYLYFNSTSPLPVTTSAELVAAACLPTAVLRTAAPEVKAVLDPARDYATQLWPVQVELSPSQATTGRTVHVVAQENIPLGLAVGVFVLKGNQRTPAGAAPLATLADNNNVRDVPIKILPGDQLYLLASNTGSQAARVGVFVRGVGSLTIEPAVTAAAKPQKEYPFAAKLSALPTTTTKVIYRWNFGDKTHEYNDPHSRPDPKIQESKTAHGYVKPGEYVVRVQALDTSMPGTPVLLAEATAKIIVVPDTEVKLSFDPALITADPMVNVEILATVTNPPEPATYVWSFGDDEPPARTTTPRAEHVFRKEGTFRMTLKVFDARGTQLAIARGEATVAGSVATVLVKTYHPNGKLSAEGVVIAGTVPAAPYAADLGVRHGPFKYYHENGQLQEEGNTSHGAKVGLWTSYHENGEKFLQGRYSDAGNEVRVGQWVEWFDTGKLREEQTYDGNGQLNGPHRNYHEDGTKMAEWTDKDGQPDGSCTGWFRNGAVFLEFTYLAGRRHGTFRAYHNNKSHQLRIEVRYQNGVEVVGSGKCWGADGKPQPLDPQWARHLSE